MRWKRFREIVELLAKIAAVLLAALAVQQFHHSKQVELQQLAIEAVTRTKSPEVLEALVRLEMHHERDDLEYEGVRRDIALVIHWYDYVALLYVSDSLVNKCIVKGSMGPYANLIQKILNELNYPVERRSHFDLLMNRMQDDACPPSPRART